jgi:hypothetical protein
MKTEYGHRRFGVEDPEAHQWYFAEPVRTPPRRRQIEGTNSADPLSDGGAVDALRCQRRSLGFRATELSK